MADTHRRGWGTERKKEHTHEHEAPRMQKFPGSWDNDEAAGSALPVDSPLVTDGRQNSEIGASLTGNYMRPVYDEAHESAYIRESHSNGKKG